MITRYLEQHIYHYLHQSKTIIIYGPRQAGKTTLVKKIYENYTGTKQYILADFIGDTARLTSRDRTIYTHHMDGLQLLIIDEAQRIPDIGLILKALHDTFPSCQIIATGSSSFSLAQHTQEPLTGRKTTLTLMPLGIHELYTTSSQLQEHYNSLLIYGLYPDVYTQSSSTQKQHIINEITQSYIFKDILIFEGIKKSDTIVKLCKLLAYQIGKPVVLSELANKLQISAPTVQRYLNILEQAFIIFRLGSYAKNLRKEVAKGQKYYFRDIGVRNAIIDMYTPVIDRPDVGEIRENFVIAEILKQHLHTRSFGTYYFRRTYDDQEIDLLYEHNGILHAYEIKRSDREAKTPVAFREHYPDAPFMTLNRYNLLEHLLTTNGSHHLSI